MSFSCWLFGHVFIRDDIKNPALIWCSKCGKGKLLRYFLPYSMDTSKLVKDFDKGKLGTFFGTKK